ncbi:hypothetical protein B0H14DRAFT_3444753 [Mycena olivaceomarginata]|nr:hypothetical protein B0H14DRAFT_3444753 [Mycena olivaceomarginata]
MTRKARLPTRTSPPRTRSTGLGAVSARKSRTKVFAAGMDLATTVCTSVAISSSSPKATAVVVSDASPKSSTVHPGSVAEEE